MKELEIGNVNDFMESIKSFLNTINGVEEVRFDPNICGGKITRKKVVKTITTTTSELIEDDQLVNDLVDFCKNRYTFDCRYINEFRVKDLLENKLRITNIYKYDKDGDYIYVMNYPDIYNYRYEGDYNPDAEPTIRRYSFSEVLDEFIELHPDKCRWKETVETKVVEE